MGYTAPENIMGIWYDGRPLHQRNINFYVPYATYDDPDDPDKVPNNLDQWLDVYDFKKTIWADSPTARIVVRNFRAYIANGKGKYTMQYITYTADSTGAGDICHPEYTFDVKKTLAFRYNNEKIQCLIGDKSYFSRQILAVVQYTKYWS